MTGTLSGHHHRQVGVLHIHKITGISGSENHLRLLLPALDPSRFSVSLLMLITEAEVDTGFVSELEASGIAVHRLPIRAHLDPVLAAKLTMWIRRERPAIVHTHLIHADVHGTLAGALAGAPVIISTRHNDDPFRRHPTARLIDRLLVRRASHVIAISESIRRFTMDVAGVPPSRVSTVHYGYEPRKAVSVGMRDRFGIPPHAGVVLCVGRLVQQKGQRDLVEAFAEVVRRVPDAHLVIIGEGPLRGELERRAAALGISLRVHLPGYLADAASAMAEASLYAHPSHWEGFGLVLLEAMAAGLAVVAARVSAIPEIVEDGRTGTLVPPGNAPALAHAVATLLLDRERRERYGARGAARVRIEFSVSKMARGTERIYEACLAQRPHLTGALG